MCGIAGIVRWNEQPVLEHEIRSMCDLMVHRGPDEDGTVWVVFNGEIYNYAALRSDLEQRGHQFRTTSDS